MKQKNILFIFFVALSAVFACERVDESKLEGNNSAVETVEMTFNAVIDREGDTKTVLGGELGDGVRKVMWQPGDAIGVSSNTLAMGEAHPGIYFVLSYATSSQQPFHNSTKSTIAIKNSRFVGHFVTPAWPTGK